MARKPIPKTQKEISRNLNEPYQDNFGNPNIAPNDNEQQTGIQFNRSTKLSFREDTTKQFKVGLEDIDEAVFYYFNNIIKPFVYQNNERVSVPVIYSSPENWKSFQRDGYYRDKNGAIMLPIIAMNKTNIQKDRTVANKLDANHPNMYFSTSTSYNSKNSYSNFDILNNRKPIKKYHLSVIPSYVTIEYSCLIQTYYIDQLNKIIEAIEYSSDSYWGDPERFKFRTFIDNFLPTVNITSENERYAKSTFNLRLRGYILPDNIQKDLNSAKLYYSKSNINITSEIVSDINDI